MGWTLLELPGKSIKIVISSEQETKLLILIKFRKVNEQVTEWAEH